MAERIAINRLRHVLRRVREVPPSFLLKKLGMLIRSHSMQPHYAALRYGLVRTRGPAFAPTFAAMGEALRETVQHAQRTDREYADGLKTRLAQLLDARRLPVLGYGPIPFPVGAAWREDRTTGYRWPLAYFPFVNFLTHGRDADVKAAWEPSRLQWLVWIGEGVANSMESAERGEAAAAFRRGLEDWDRENPVGFGPNWTVAMEVAIRAINLGLATALAGEAVDDDTRSRARRLLWQHLVYLRRFPEVSDRNGNHYLVGRCGVVFLEWVVFGENTRRTAALGSLLQDLEAQFDADGLHIEHAPLYHRLCVETVLWIAAWVGRAEGALPAGLEALIVRAGGALASLEMRSGSLPALGDADSGQIVSFGEAGRGLGYLRRLLGVELGGPPLLAACGGPSMRTAAIRRSFESTPPSAMRRVGPFVRLMRKDVDLVLRAGPHGLFGRASHDHDDNGSPWVSFGARELLVDGGCYSYTRSLEERLRDISSASHNLVTVGGRRRFLPRPGAMSPTVAWAPIATVEPSVADGLSSADESRLEISLRWTDEVAGVVHHRRRVTLGAGGRGGAPALMVDDKVELERDAPLCVRWHFAPAWTLEAESETVVLARHVDGVDQVRVAFDLVRGRAPLRLALAPFRFSGRYGERESATVIELTLLPAASVRVRSRFDVAASA